MASVRIDPSQVYTVTSSLMGKLFSNPKMTSVMGKSITGGDFFSYRKDS